MSVRVLCIESDAPTRARVRTLLEAMGCAVDEGATGLEGLARARAAAPDLVLAGTRMPDVRHAELAARLRAETALGQVPLVAVGQSPAEREIALAAGWDGFIPRTVDDSTFIAEVRAYRAGKRERLSAEERHARQLLAERERRGSAFIHDLAHELSTPLTPLAGYLKILGSDRVGPLSAQQRKIVDSLSAAVAKLTRIVDNLADFANLQRGPAAITVGPVDPEALAAEVVEALRPPAREAHVHVELRRGEGPPLLADARKLRQAVENVLGNAIKFSPHGGEVLLEVRRDPGWLRFDLWDQGPGVARGDFDRIFEPFSHADRRDDARLPGSGLGLPVARRIAEAHGGRIALESPPASQPTGSGHTYSGSRFVIELPARAVPAAGA